MVDEISELLSQLEKFDRNKPPDLQLQACIKLAELGKTTSIQNKQRIINALKEAINCDNCAATRAQAVEALGDLGAKDGIERLKSSLQDPYRLVRSYSIKALRKLNDGSAIYALMNCLENSDEFYGVRCEAAAALKYICYNRSSDDCQDAWRTLDETVRECEEALKNPDLDEEKRIGYERIKKEAQRERRDLRPF